MFATAAALHRADGRVGLRGVGHGLLLPALRRVRRRAIRRTTRSTRPTATAPGTTPGPAPTAAARRCTDRTAAPAWARATTRAPAPMRAAPPRTARTARAAAAEAYNPRTGAYGATRQGSSVYGSWGQTGVQRGDQWAHDRARRPTTRPGTTTRATQGERRRRRRHAVAGRRGSGGVGTHRQRRRLRRPRRQRLPQAGRQLAKSGPQRRLERRRFAGRPRPRDAVWHPAARSFGSVWVRFVAAQS